MPDDPAFPWDHKPPPPQRRPSTSSDRSETAVRAVEFGGRISLKEAESRFGVPVSRLRSWARSGTINGVKGSGPTGGRMWLVTPESVAHQLSRTVTETPSPPAARTGPTPDGSAMLVPRDAWDRLMDQLGNLHDAGIQLAEARERAAKAETEASFLRERLAEMRSERDRMREEAEPSTSSASTASSRSAASSPTITDRLRDAYLKLLGK